MLKKRETLLKGSLLNVEKDQCINLIYFYALCKRIQFWNPKDTIWQQMLPWGANAQLQKTHYRYDLDLNIKLIL